MKPSSEADGYFASYKQFSNILRSWLIAYGIGVPVFMLSQEHVWNALKNSCLATVAGSLFVFGVVMQVLFAAFFKWAMWVIWMGVDDASRRETRGYKIAHWASDKYFIDFITDVGAMALFTIATVILLGVIFS